MIRTTSRKFYEEMGVQTNSFDGVCFRSLNLNRGRLCKKEPIRSDTLSGRRHVRVHLLELYIRQRIHPSQLQTFNAYSP